MSTSAFGDVSVGGSCLATFGSAQVGRARRSAWAAWSRVAVLVVAGLCLAPTPGLALPVYDVGSRVDAALLSRVQDFDTTTDGSPASSHAAVNALGRIGSADASAGGGYIGVRASAYAENIGGVIHTVDSFSGGSFEVSILTGSCGGVFACGSTSTSINLSLGGAFLASDDGPVGANAEGYVGVYIRLQQNGTTIFSESGSAGAITVPDVGLMPWNNGTNNPPTGMMSGYTLNAPFNFQTDSFLLAPDSEYRLLINLYVASSANTRTNLQEGDFSELTTDFSHTLTFGAGPVFNGDFDFSIDSPDANIAGNAWTDPRAVPEPGMGLLFGLGLGWTAWARRRRA